MTLKTKLHSPPPKVALCTRAFARFAHARGAEAYKFPEMREPANASVGIIKSDVYPVETFLQIHLDRSFYRAAAGPPD